MESVFQVAFEKNSRGFGPNKCKRPKGTSPALLDFIFLQSVSEEIDTPSEVNTLVSRLNDFFRGPVYTWPLTKKRTFLMLGVLSRWNSAMGPLYQDQLIQMCGLDIGSLGPNTLRAINIALTRKLDISFLAQGNGANRLYRFENDTHQEAVSQFLQEGSWSLVYQHLLTELNQHRRRRW